MEEPVVLKSEVKSEIVKMNRNKKQDRNRDVSVLEFGIDMVTEILI